MIFHSLHNYSNTHSVHSRVGCMIAINSHMRTVRVHIAATKGLQIQFVDEISHVHTNIILKQSSAVFTQR